MRQVAPVGRWLWVAAAISLGLSLTSWGQILLYAFRLLTTWVHECGHALVTVALGGSVISILIQPDASGITQSLIPAGRITQGLVARPDSCCCRPGWISLEAWLCYASPRCYD